MKPIHWWILAVVVVALAALGAFGAAMSYLLSAREGEWTTRSKAALEELEKGLDAHARGYRERALRHFDRALELDPKFVAATLHLSWMYSRSSDRLEELIAVLERVDVSRLNPRERFMVRHRLALDRGLHSEAKALLDEFLSRHPDDLFGLDLQCQSLWAGRDWEEAEACYYQLLEIDPNHVEAYNRLGKIDMAQGHFTEAEEHFRSHCYIAPDQSLPATSLAELLILLGRYPEAEQTLVKVLEIDDSYCWAHVQLVRTYYFARRFGDAEAVIERLQGVRACAEFETAGYFCNIRGLVDFLRGDFEKSWSWFDDECLATRGGFDLIGHHVALLTDRGAAALRMSERLGRRIEEVRSGAARGDLDWYEPLYAHFRGVQHMAAGNYPQASASLGQADDRLRYWMGGQSGFKLLNRFFLAKSLELEGKTGRSRALLDKIAAVNPRFAEHLPELSFLEGQQAPTQR